MDKISYFNRVVQCEVNKLTLFVKAKIAEGREGDPPDTSQEVKDTYNELRESYGVSMASKLDMERLQELMDETEATL